MRNGLVAGALVLASVCLCASQVLYDQRAADSGHLLALRHYGMGQEALRTEHYDAAEQEFQVAAGFDPTLELAPCSLGQVYMATKKYRQAVAAYQACQDVFRSNAIAAVGNEQASQRRLEDKIQALQDQLSSRMKTSNGKPSRWTMDMDMQISEMKGMRRRIAAGGPEPTPPWITLALGSAYFRADAMADAEREYREAIKVDPKIGEAHNNLAVVCLLTGRYREADAEIKAAEAAGFKVSPQLKGDLKNASKRH